MNKVLVVGGSGFIGSHLVKQTGWDNCDLLEGEDFRVEYLDFKYKAIVFLAWNMDNTSQASAYNADLLSCLDDYMVLNPSTHLVFASSAAVYSPNDEKHTEVEPAIPMTIYGRSKLNAELVLSKHKHVTILRFSNVFGEGGRGVIDLFRAGRKTIFGDGQNIRDFVPVETVVKVIIESVKHPVRWQGIFNVSSGVGQSINDVFKQYGKGRPVYKESRDFDVRHSILDNSKMKAALR